MWRAAWRSRGRPSIAFNVTSMIDVVFLLMTWFLLSAQFTGREGAMAMMLPVKAEGAPARTSDSFALPERPIEVSVRSLGDGESQYVISTDSPILNSAGPFASFADLTVAARARRGTLLPGEQRFVVRPAAGARWEHALGAMSALREAGFTTIRFGKELP